MAHRSLNTLVFAGFEPTTAAMVISMLGNDGMPDDLRIARSLSVEPWQNIRAGLLIVGMDPSTDLVRVSQLIQNRTTYWDVAVCIPEVLSYYSVALLAQGAVQVLPHPEDDLERTKGEVRSLLRNLSHMQSDAFGLEVADLIQLYGEKRMAKTLRLTGQGTVGSIFLNEGMVAHAETMEEETGMDAFRRLISLQNPEIRVHKGCLTDQRTIGIPAMSALLEGSRQEDEARNSRDSDFDSMDIELDDEFASMDAVPKFNMDDLHGGGSGQPQQQAPQPPQKFDPLANLFSDDDFDNPGRH